MKEIEPAVKKLLKKEIELKEQLEDCQTSIKALRKMCEHAWRYDGHGHNDDYYICDICGDSKWE